MLNRMPWAPVMLTSSSGLAMAWLGGLDGAVLAAGAADAHQGRAGVLHDRPHVGEVEVDQAGHRDEVADALHALAQHVVDDAEGVDDRGVLLDDVLEPVVGDRDERVDLGLAAPRRPSRRSSLRRLPSKRERLGHDADGQGAQVLAISAMTGAAPEPVPPPMPAVMKTMSESRERLGDLLGVLFGRALADATGRRRRRDRG